MLISIITINYNDARGLDATILSVQNQTLKNYEHIIIDGGSNDGSLAVIEKYVSNFSYWVSEPDAGIFNAMNKGIKASKGDYLLFLNSGDSLYSLSVLENAAKKIDEKYNIYYGNVQRVYENGIKKIKNYDKELTFSFFVDSAIAHQSAFIKRSLFNEIFYYNENYKIFADWEFFICAICKYDVPYKHLDMVVSNYDMDGISSQLSIQQEMQKERKETYKKYFPLFYKDYEELMHLKSSLNSNRIKLFLKVDGNSFTRKLNYIMLRLMNKFIN